MKKCSQGTITILLLILSTGCGIKPRRQNHDYSNNCTVRESQCKEYEYMQYRIKSKHPNLSDETVQNFLPEDCRTGSRLVKLDIFGHVRQCRDQSGFTMRGNYLSPKANLGTDAVIDTEDDRADAETERAIANERILNLELQPKKHTP